MIEAVRVRPDGTEPGLQSRLLFLMTIRKAPPDWHGPSRRLRQARAGFLFLKHRCLSQPSVAFRTAVRITHEALSDLLRL